VDVVRLRDIDIPRDDEVAPDGEAVVPEMLRALQRLPRDESAVAHAKVEEQFLHLPGAYVRRILLVDLVDEAELDVQAQAAPFVVLVEADEDGDEAGAFWTVAVGEEVDDPGVASRREGQDFRLVPLGAFLAME
jgi:hypothetical protein